MARKRLSRSRTAHVICRDLVDRERGYDARFDAATDRDGFLCARCGETVPATGNKIHEVRDSRRAAVVVADGDTDGT